MITKNDARQDVSAAFVDMSFDDFVSGVAEEAIQLPSGAIVTGGYLEVVTAFNSATSDAMGIGDSGAGALYAGAVNMQAVGVTNLAVVAKEYPVVTELLATLTSVGTPTAGAARLVVEYIATGKSDFTQG